VVRTGLPVLRRVLDAHDLPDDGPVRPIGELQDSVARVVSMRLESNYGQLTTVLPVLLPELHRALDLHVGQRRAEVARLLTQTYRAADAIADKFGFFDLSARIIELMASAARESGDELMVAAAAYVRAETFFANGDLDVGQRMLEHAANRLMPEANAGAAAAYGALHMRSAVLAARAGHTAAAYDHLAESRQVARRIPEGVYAGTVFGPASVRINSPSPWTLVTRRPRCVRATAGHHRTACPPNGAPTSTSTSPEPSARQEPGSGRWIR